MSDHQEFEARNHAMIEKMKDDETIQTLTHQWFHQSFAYEYPYHFRWMGVPIIQYPQDIVAMQEIIWKVKPDLIIETGIARGGSLIFYASMLKMMDIEGDVIGIDIDIRQHNRVVIESHPMFEYITLLEGSSTDPKIVEQVQDKAVGKQHILVLLDSLHTHDHVLQEINLYSPLVTKGSYLVIFDTVVEDMDASLSENRPWSPGNNPKTAVREFLQTTDRFEVDDIIQNKLLITVAPEGYLRCVR